MQEYIRKPLLTEFRTKYYVNSALKDVRKFKDKYITIAVNIILFLLFLGIVAGLLYYKYKGKLTIQEKKQKAHEKKMYLYKKLQQYSYNKQKQNESIITNLPLIHPENNLIKK